jgi:hypothetical protein
MATTAQPTALTSTSRARSVAAVLGALVLNAVASAAVDQLLHRVGIFPPWTEVTYAPLPYALALGYRTLFGIAAAYLAARWAPRSPGSPMRHALALGAVGVTLSLGGVVAALTRDLGPLWYPVALLVVTPPAAWLGGALREREARR